MRLVRYIPRAFPTHSWDETFVEEPDDPDMTPTYYHYHGDRRRFTESLASLVQKGKWQRAVHPDMEVDVGL